MLEAWIKLAIDMALLPSFRCVRGVAGDKGCWRESERDMMQLGEGGRVERMEDSVWRTCEGCHKGVVPASRRLPGGLSRLPGCSSSSIVDNVVVSDAVRKSCLTVVSGSGLESWRSG